MGLGGGVGTRTHPVVHSIEVGSQELLARHLLRDGKSENLNQQRRCTVRWSTAEGICTPCQKCIQRKIKGFQFPPSKFEGGCACAMWADPLVLSDRGWLSRYDL